MFWNCFKNSLFESSQSGCTLTRNASIDKKAVFNSKACFSNYQVAVV